MRQKLGFKKCCGARGLEGRERVVDNRDADVGKVTLKSNGDEALNDESLKKVTVLKR